MSDDFDFEAFESEFEIDPELLASAEVGRAPWLATIRELELAEHEAECTSDDPERCMAEFEKVTDLTLDRMAEAQELFEIEITTSRAEPHPDSLTYAEAAADWSQVAIVELKLNELGARGLANIIAAGERALKADMMMGMMFSGGEVNPHQVAEGDKYSPFQSLELVGMIGELISQVGRGHVPAIPDQV